VANPNGRKGADWELRLEPALRDHGFPYATRLGKQGVNDKGDFTHTLPFCFEAKNQGTLNFSGWLKEAEREAGLAGARFPVVFAKRRNHQLMRGYAVMEIGRFLMLTREFMELKRLVEDVMPHLAASTD
jgi:hypothetical protein